MQFLRYWHWTNIWTSTDSKRIKYIFLFNPLTPMNDQDRTSPYNINTISCRQVMRINKNINQGIISWSKTKFSKLTLQELYSRQFKENYYWDLGSNRVNQSMHFTIFSCKLYLQIFQTSFNSNNLHFPLSCISH